MGVQIPRGLYPPSAAARPCTRASYARHLGEAFRKLAAQKESLVLEGHLMAGRCFAHMLIAIPPKYAVSQVVGFITRASVPSISARVYGERRRNFVGNGEFLGAGLLRFHRRSG